VTAEPSGRETIVPRHTLHRLISGGQTGVDRGALDAALEMGFPCGGWCPRGRRAEDGRIPDRYPLQELPRGGRLGRTRKNVEDSDATAIIYFGKLAGGTRRAYLHCVEAGKPHSAVDGQSVAPDGVAQAFAIFLEALNVGCVNVAGPRASEAPGAEDFAHSCVSQLIAAIGDWELGNMARAQLAHR
jgi:hypothetical protein